MKSKASIVVFEFSFIRSSICEIFVSRRSFYVSLLLPTVRHHVPALRQWVIYKINHKICKMVVCFNFPVHFSSLINKFAFKFWFFVFTLQFITISYLMNILWNTSGVLPLQYFKSTSKSLILIQKSQFSANLHLIKKTPYIFIF